jgi:hypothetical protein
MNYFDPIKSLIVYGGRDNQVSGTPFFADIGVLNMLNMNWIGVCTYGEKIEERCSHMAFLHGSKLVLFGGINQRGFVNGDIAFLEMDQNKISNMMFESQEKEDLSKDILAGKEEDDTKKVRM